MVHAKEKAKEALRYMILGHCISQFEATGLTDASERGKRNRAKQKETVTRGPVAKVVTRRAQSETSMWINWPQSVQDKELPPLPSQTTLVTMLLLCGS